MCGRRLRHGWLFLAVWLLWSAGSCWAQEVVEVPKPVWLEIKQQIIWLTEYQALLDKQLDSLEMAHLKQIERWKAAYATQEARAKQSEQALAASNSSLQKSKLTTTLTVMALALETLFVLFAGLTGGIKWQ